MTYDEIIDLLTAKCLENGKGVAKLGNDVAFMMSEEYLLGLLVAARLRERQASRWTAELNLP
jgi:hypothetical protein